MTTIIDIPEVTQAAFNMDAPGDALTELPAASTPETELVEGTGNALVDQLVVDAILQAQRSNHPPKTAALDAVKALHAAVTEWNKLVGAE